MEKFALTEFFRPTKSFSKYIETTNIRKTGSSARRRLEQMLNIPSFRLIFEGKGSEKMGVRSRRGHSHISALWI
jgi:hypothetical protein